MVCVTSRDSCQRNVMKPKKDKHSNPSFLLSHTWRKLRQNGSNPTMISNYETFRDGSIPLLICMLLIDLLITSKKNRLL